VAHALSAPCRDFPNTSLCRIAPRVGRSAGAAHKSSCLTIFLGTGTKGVCATHPSLRVDSGPLPLSDSTIDSSGKFIVGGLKVRAVMEANNPSVNIEVMANDVITVAKADLIYVIGAVKKPGGFVLNEKENLSALQALSLAEGLEGTAPDLPLRANDILFVPGNKAKNITVRALKAAIQVGVGAAIWR
jgi:hypothetical protein